MPSPFPEMDPFLEVSGVWPDFHASVLTYCRDALNDRLPDHYVARIDERFGLVEIPDRAERQVRPDVAVVSGAPAFFAGRSPSRAAGAVTLEPVTVPLPSAGEEVRQRRVEVRHRSDHTLVTAIELLSPANKTEPGHSDYLLKRNALFRQRVNLVEIDLLVGGHRLPMAGPLPSGDYYAFVARGETIPDCSVYAWSVRTALPTLPIPLKAPDADVPLELAGVIATAYERGRYGRSIEYGAPLTLPLKPEDRAWAEGLAREPRR